VSLDPGERLRSLGVTINEVYQAVARQQPQNASGALLDQNPTVAFIRTEGLATAADSWQYRRRTSTFILVRDVRYRLVPPCATGHDPDN
jgi:Cu/Ag efflux pump CusA